MGKTSKRRLLLAAIALVLFVAGSMGGAVYYMFFTHPYQIAKTTYIFIDRDDNMDSVMAKVVEVGEPTHTKGLNLLMERGKYAGKIRTGKYAINATDTHRTLYRRLSAGNQTPVKLVMGSVATLQKLARNVSRQLMIDSAEVAQLMFDKEYVGSLSYTAETLPSLFIPNTYEVFWDISAEKFMQRMVREHKAFWNDDRMKKAKELGMNPAEVSTLASIVEGETALAADKPIVAGLYINRLRLDMPLQACPTVIYAVGDPTLQRVLFKHLEIDSPYNTYKYKGLPPGPISIPSIQGIDAVLNYTHHNYLYMCAKEDFSGGHYFTASGAQHAANARKYQHSIGEFLAKKRAK